MDEKEVTERKIKDTNVIWSSFFIKSFFVSVSEYQAAAMGNGKVSSISSDMKSKGTQTKGTSIRFFYLVQALTVPIR